MKIETSGSSLTGCGGIQGLMHYWRISSKGGDYGIGQIDSHGYLQNTEGLLAQRILDKIHVIHSFTS